MISITDILLREKICKSLIFLLEPSEERKTISFIAKKADITWGHFYQNIVKILKENNIIETEKKGRNVELTLTTKGYIIAQRMKTIYYKLEEIKGGVTQ